MSDKKVSKTDFNISKWSQKIFFTIIIIKLKIRKTKIQKTTKFFLEFSSKGEQRIFHFSSKIFTKREKKCSFYKTH